MAAIKELLRAEEDGTLSFGDYSLSSKTKLDNFEFEGDIYKVKTFAEITKLERNGMFVYESVPGSAVEHFKATAEGVSFEVSAAGDVQFTLEINCIGETATNVGIENMLTGEVLRLEKTIVEDERVVIKTSHGKTTVTSSKDGDCRGALTLESTLYRIHTGDNAWKPTADSGLENVEMSVSFAEESAGVTVI